MKQTVALAAVVGLLLGQAQGAEACVFSVDEITVPRPSVAERDRLREECWQLRWNRRENLRAVQRARLDAAQADDLAAQYERSEYGCPGDKAFAFTLREAALPRTLFDMVNQQGNLVLAVAGDLDAYGQPLGATRARDIRLAAWLKAIGTGSHTPAPAEVDSLLADPQLRPLVLQHHGRDRAVLDALSDPHRPSFNRQQFADLVRNGGSLEDGVKAARLLLDPAFGPPDYPLAGAVLRRYALSPYVQLGDPAIEAQGLALLRQTWQHMATSTDPAERERAAQLLATGDPDFARRALVALPENAAVLDQWPELLGPPAWQVNPDGWNRIIERLGAAYPTRSVRLEEAGPVETALHYGPDGAFVGVAVLRSSGSLTLDGAAVQAWTRYLRPRPLAQLPAAMIAGHDQFIRLPTIAYYLQGRSSDTAQAVATQDPDGTIRVTANPPIRTDLTEGGCGGLLR